MPRTAKPGVDWPAIRERYIAGEAASAIARDMGTISKQAIYKKAERRGWAQPPRTTRKATNKVLSRDGWSTGLATKDLYTPEKGAQIIERTRQGANYKLAAASVGISDSTLSGWRKASPDFEAAISEAQAFFALQHVGNIAKAGDQGDWKASDRLLQSHPLTKDDMGQAQTQGGVTIVLNVPRADMIDVTSEIEQ